MNYKIVNGAVSYGADTILEEINFEIKDKDKIAIVGRKSINVPLICLNGFSELNLILVKVFGR